MKKLFKKLLVLVLMASSLVNVGGVSAQETKQVVTTFYPVYFLAQSIAGDKLEVSMLLDKGQGAHGYETTAQDVVRVQEADMFIYLDDEMEYFVEGLKTVINSEKTQVVKTTEGIEMLKGSDHGVAEHEHEGEEAHEHEGEEEHENEGEEAHEHEGEEAHDHEHEGEAHNHEYDPHTWLDPLTYAQQAENIKAAFIELDPDNAATYEENTKALVAELTQLDEEFKTQLASLENRTIVVQHAAFGYLCHAYDLQQVAITGLNTTQEPSAKTIAEMQNFMKENGAKTIYVDPSISPEISEAVAGATGAELLPFRTLESVSNEEMSQGVDYFTIMRDNLSELLKNK